MQELEEILSLLFIIISKSKKVLIFKHKCSVVASTLDDIKIALIKYYPKDRLQNEELIKIKNYLNNISNIIDMFSSSNYIWSFIQADQPFKQITDINEIISKINQSLHNIGITSSFNLPLEEIYHDLDQIDNILYNTLQLINKRRVDIEEYFKQTSQETFLQTSDEDNRNELNKYPKFKKKVTDFSYDMSQTIDEDTVFTYYKGTWLENQQNVAIANLKDKSIFKRLLSVLTLIDHPNVETLIGAYIDNSNITIVTNRDGLQLYNLIYLNHLHDQISIESGDQTILAFKIAQAMSYLHSQNIIHRNLHSSNIYVTKKLNKENRYEISPTVSGFKNSRLIPERSSFGMSNLNINSAIPVSSFTAPELDDGNYDEKVDVFAFAGILYEMLTGHPPFGSEPGYKVIELLKNGERPTLPSNISQDLKDLIEICWEQKPEARFSFDEVIEFMMTNKIIFPLDQPKSDLVLDFYKSNSIKSNIVYQCLDTFKMIMKFIERADQYRFEFLRIRPIINHYKYLFMSKFSGKQSLNTNEIGKILDYRLVINDLRKLICEQKNNFIKERLNAYLDNPSENYFSVTKVTTNLNSLMDKLYLSMKLFGFDEVEKYQQNIDDIVFDYRELELFLKRYIYPDGTSPFERQIEDINLFKSELKLDETYTKEAINRRLKDLFSPFKKFELNRSNFSEPIMHDSKSGSTCRIFQALYFKMNEIVAIKELTSYVQNCDIQLVFLRREIGYLTQLEHKYIADFIGYSMSNIDNSVWLVFKYYQYSLFDRLYIVDILSPEERTKVAFKIAKGMNFIHSQKILHLDLKPSNIMMEGNEPKIIDFGFSSPDIYEFNKKLKVGTSNYMAPEVFSLEECYDSKADVYSFAMMLLELTTKKVPFADKNGDEIMKVVKNGFEPNFDRDVHLGLQNIIRDGLKRDPKERPTFEMIINRMIAEKVCFPGSNDVEITKFYESKFTPKGRNNMKKFHSFKI